MRVVQSLYGKKANLLLPDGIRDYTLYIMISNIFSTVFAAITFVTVGNFTGCNWLTVAIAVCSGTFLAIGSFCGIKALKGGTIVLSSIFGTAGLLVPCILGIFVFNEAMSFMQVICIAVLLISAVLLVDSSKKIFEGFSIKTLLYLLGNLITNGMVMFCQKLFGELMPDGNVVLFSMLTFLIPTICLCIALLFMRGNSNERHSESFPKKLVLYAMFLAFAVFIIQQFVTELTPVLSSAVLFTFVNGGATVIAAIVGALVYKEKITLKSATGIVLGIAALIFIKVLE